MPRPDDELQSDQRWLRRHARRVARSPGAVDDLVQETYLTALTRPPPDGPMRPWLLGVLRKLAWGEARSDRRRVHREELFHRSEPSVAEPDPLLTYGIDPALLRARVESLPQPFRSTVEQRFIEGLSCAEIARAAGVPAGTVRWRQSRALEMLRAELEPPARRRPRRGVLWLPLVGLERVVAVGGRLVEPGRRGVLALVGAAVLLVVTTLGVDQRPLDREVRAAGPAAASSAIAHQAVSAFAAPVPQLAGEAVLASLAPADPDGEDDLVSLAAWDLDDEPGRTRRRGSGGAGPVGPRRDLYDCTEVDGELRCARQAVAADQPGGPVCVILERSLDALERGLSRAARPRSLHGETFLRAARLADLLLVAELGCGLVAEPDDDDQGGRGGGGGAAARAEVPEVVGPTCRSEDDASGRTCTTCTDGLGAETTVCAPVDCQPATRTDGTACTTCTDADGQVDGDCEGPPPTGCDQVLGGLEVFTLEILPILTGEIDLNDTEDLAIGCIRGPCHGQPRTDTFSIPLDAPPEDNLARVACYVDLARPEDSMILLCGIDDERCLGGFHPGGPRWSGVEDLNYQRVLAFLQAAGP